MNRRAKPKPDEDPVVAEVRAVRAKLWRRSGRSLERYFDLVNRLASKAGAPRRATPAQRKSA